MLRARTAADVATIPGEFFNEWKSKGRSFRAWFNQPVFRVTPESGRGSTFDAHSSPDSVADSATESRAAVEIAGA